MQWDIKIRKNIQKSFNQYLHVIMENHTILVFVIKGVEYQGNTVDK